MFCSLLVGEVYSLEPEVTKKTTSWQERRTIAEVKEAPDSDLSVIVIFAFMSSFITFLRTRRVLTITLYVSENSFLRLR